MEKELNNDMLMDWDLRIMDIVREMRAVDNTKDHDLDYEIDNLENVADSIRQMKED